MNGLNDKKLDLHTLGLLLKYHLFYVTKSLNTARGEILLIKDQ